MLKKYGCEPEIWRKVYIISIFPLIMGIPIGLAKAVGRKLDREGIRGEAIPPREYLIEKVADAPLKIEEESPQDYQIQQPKYR